MTNKLPPEPTDEYTVAYTFITSGLRRVEYDTQGLGLLLHFQSLETPSEALCLVLEASDAQRVAHALRALLDRVQAALEAPPANGSSH